MPKDRFVILRHAFAKTFAAVWTPIVQTTVTVISEAVKDCAPWVVEATIAVKQTNDAKTTPAFKCVILMIPKVVLMDSTVTNSIDAQISAHRMRTAQKLNSVTPLPISV